MSPMMRAIVSKSVVQNPDGTFKANEEYKSVPQEEDSFSNMKSLSPVNEQKLIPLKV